MRRIEGLNRVTSQRGELGREGHCRTGYDFARSAEGFSFSPSVVERGRMHEETFTLLIQNTIGC